MADIHLPPGSGVGITPRANMIVLKCPPSPDAWCLTLEQARDLAERLPTVIFNARQQAARQPEEQAGTEPSQ